MSATAPPEINIEHEPVAMNTTSLTRPSNNPHPIDHTYEPIVSVVLVLADPLPAFPVLCGPFVSYPFLTVVSVPVRAVRPATIVSVVPVPGGGPGLSSQ